MLLPFSDTYGLSFWTFISFFLLYAVGTVGQPQFTTRFYTIRKVDMLRWAPAIAASCYFVITFFLFAGMIYRAAVLQGKVPALTNPDMAVSQYIVTFMNPTMAGLVLAAAVAAIMSTVSTFIVVAASTITRDILEQGMGKKLSESQGLLYSRLASIVICLLTVLLAVKPPDLIAWLGNAAFGFLSASLSVGGGLSLVLYFMKTAKMINPKLDTGAIAFLVSIGVMVVVSVLTPEQVRSVLPAPKNKKATATVPAPENS